MLLLAMRLKDATPQTFPRQVRLSSLVPHGSISVVVLEIMTVMMH